MSRTYQTQSSHYTDNFFYETIISLKWKFLNDLKAMQRQQESHQYMNDVLVQKSLGFKVFSALIGYNTMQISFKTFYEISEKYQI